jgi:hypothetical protein
MKRIQGVQREAPDTDRTQILSRLILSEIVLHNHTKAISIVSLRVSSFTLVLSARISPFLLSKRQW